jgi:hypothetical protein
MAGREERDSVSGPAETGDGACSGTIDLEQGAPVLGLLEIEEAEP